jgi:hypothetical protein
MRDRPRPHALAHPRHGHVEPVGDLGRVEEPLGHTNASKQEYSCVLSRPPRIGSQGTLRAGSNRGARWGVRQLRLVPVFP